MNTYINDQLWQLLNPAIPEPAAKPVPPRKLRLAKSDVPMSAGEFKTNIAELGFTQSAFARWIGRDGRTIRQWVSGRYPVPREIGYLVSLMQRTGRRP